MYKFNAMGIMIQSLTYAFSSAQLWIFMFLVFCVDIAQYFLYELTATTRPGVEYLYDFFGYIFFIWGFLVIALVVLRSVRGEPCSLTCCMRMGAKQLVGAWWFVAWLTLLAWAKNSLICGPYLVSEGVDLLLLTTVSLLQLLQLALNFFMIPEIADKNYAILHLYVHAFDGLRKQLFHIVQFFLMLFLLFLATGLLLLSTVYALRVATECVILCPWMHGISKAIVEAGATTITLTVLVVAQTLFYLGQQETAVVDTNSGK